MCGIFALFNNSDSLYHLDEHTINYINSYFNKGKCRGPENSVLKNINDNILFGFHRLAINGLNDISNQPICIDGVYLICNGEIYNYKNIYNQLNIKPKTKSDCESIIHLYKKYGIKYTLQNLDGVFSFILYDSIKEVSYIARDPFGVRPLYFGINTDNYGQENYVFSSLLKQIIDICPDCYNFKAGTYMKISLCMNKYTCSYIFKKYTNFNYDHNSIHNNIITNNSQYYQTIYNTLFEAVKKRVITMERNLACLLSGGLDSSLISALVSKFVPSGQLQTYSIGMDGGSDLTYAKMVSTHINSNHTEIILTEDDFFNAIKDVIYSIESYDTTTVRASVGNYLIAKYISEHSDAKVIFNGDGSDELTGGYMYFHNCPSDIEFDFECKRLLKNIQYFDVLRSDRCISSHGLEARTPFLDRTFVHSYLSLPINIRNHNNGNNIEKYLLRKSIEQMEPNLLPQDVLWRSKEAFSDGVSSQDKSWFEIIQSKLEDKYSNETFEELKKKYDFNPPTTKEQLYYREIFENYYPEKGYIIPHFWMPQYTNATDSSARNLKIYKDKMNTHKVCIDDYNISDIDNDSESDFSL